MSTRGNTTAEKSMSKTVNIVCYLDVADDLEKRDVMDTLHRVVDYYETRNRTHTNHYLITDDGVERIYEEVYDKLENIDSDDLMVCKVEKDKERYHKSRSDFSRRLRKDVLEGVDLCAPDSEMSVRFGRKVMLNARKIFNLSADGPDRMGMLKHPSEVGDGSDAEIWADKGSKHWTATVTAEVNSVDPTTYRWFDNAVIPEIKENCAKHEWVERTRVMDCSKEMREEGVCYDVF